MRATKKSGTSGTLLVVEDDPILSGALAGGFTDAGYKVLQVLTGEDAVPTAMRERPDLVMLDIKLPGMSGWQVLVELRKKMGSQVPPVVIFTMIEPDSSILKLINEYQPTYYLLKSYWTVEGIVQKIKELLAKKPASLSSTGIHHKP